jgi:xylulokinase
MKTVLGIDLGTQSLKLLFYDYATRTVVASESSPLEVMRTEDGSAEQDAAWWLHALTSALGRVSDDVRNSVQAVGVSGQQHGLVALDAGGAVLLPVKLWCDTATQREADEITDACGGRDRCIELCGNPVLTGYTAPKIRWLAGHRPDLYRRMTRILLPHDYLNFVLTGAATMEYGDASGTALLDVRSRKWQPEMLRAVDASRDLAGCLPPLLEPGDIAGMTDDACSRRFGLPAGIPVATGGGDNMMAAIGTGNVLPGRLTMSLGTSGTLFAYSDTPVIDPDGNIAAFCSSTGGWLPLLCTMNCTQATELVRRPFGITTAQFDETIGAVEAGAKGLIVLPFFNGERTPNLPHASASFLGLNPQNCSAAHLLRATVEGATYGLRYGLDVLTSLGLEASEVMLTGGGSKSAVWRQIVADVCQLPVTLPTQDEGASFGAALQALWMLRRQAGPNVDISDVTEEHVRGNADLCRTPDRSNAARYERSYAAYRQAVAALSPVFNINGASR